MPGITEQLAGDCDATRRVEHMDDRLFPGRLDTHSCVHLGGRRPSDQQRLSHSTPFHFGGNMHHLIQRRGDQSTQTDDIDLVTFRLVQDAIGWHHDPKVYDLIVVAAQHHADNVLADIVHVTFHRCQQHTWWPFFPVQVLFLGLDVRDQPRNSLLHDTGTLHHLGKKHLSSAEQVPDPIHSGHQRALNDLQSLPKL